ncbi:MAG TPA: site-specific integrase [Pseudolabrys sp.]|jgi:integrase|nr:site-specific integrase [Pseudolabrys sp.]
MAKVRKRTWTNKAGEQSAWIAQYSSPGPDGKPKRHIETFKTKKEAAAWLARTVVEVQQGLHTPASSSITIAEAGEQWIAQAEMDGLEASTIRQYRQHLDHHIKPFLGSIKLADLTPGGAQHFRNTLIKEGRSRVMAQKVFSSLGSILAEAMTTGRVARNVVREQARQNRRRNRVEKRHERRIEIGVDVPGKEEIRAILEHAGGRWRPLIVTAVFTGLRASELRGLRWDDVDLDRGVLTVRQRADRWNAIGSPKSDSGKREVPLAPMVVNVLRKWRLTCPRIGTDHGTEGRLWLVFPNSKGNVQTLPSIHRRGLGPLQVAAGITMDKLHPKYGLHSFRHAAASLFIEQGFTPKRVQALMGHSTIQMTFDTYGHLFPSEKDDQVAMQQLQARLVS